MKHKILCDTPQRRDTLFLSESGLHIREVIIEAGLDRAVHIGHLSDIHYNYCNSLDLQQADPVILSTLEHRRWLANGASVPNARRCLEYLRDTDLLVLNGDTLDYLSHGTRELMQREIWDKYPHVLATLGGHEPARQMQGTVADPIPWEASLEVVQQFWKHDIWYEARMVGEKVLAIGLFNDRASFYACQYPRLAADLALARKNGYIVLIFCHEPLATGNPDHSHITAADAMLVGDPSAFPDNFCDGRMAGGQCSDAVTREVYDLITRSADVVKGVFTGHTHSHLHLEISAKLPDGSDTVIPQYIHSATAYDSGHLMHITVR